MAFVHPRIQRNCSWRPPKAVLTIGGSGRRRAPLLNRNASSCSGLRLVKIRLTSNPRLAGRTLPLEMQAADLGSARVYGRRGTRVARILLVSILYAACAPTTAPLSPVSKAPQQPIDYLKTLGGGWRIRLTDDHRAATVCQYGLTVGPARRFNKTLYLRAEFENPLSRSSPLITDAKLEPWMGELSIHSPEVRGLRKGGLYSIRVHVFDHPDRKKEIGVHNQTIPARLNVNSDGSVSF
jgi:hypothetical protein